MTFIRKVKDFISNKFDNQKYDAQRIAAIQKDVSEQQQLAYEEEYRARALEIAKQRAISDAHKSTGFSKLRGVNNMQNLDKPKLGVFKDLSDYTQKNLARRQENLNKTAMLRETAKMERFKRQQLRPNNLKSIRQQNYGYHI